MITWRRGERRAVAPHFSTHEFTCSCGVCVPQRLDAELVRRLEAVRADLALEVGQVVPIRVTSGFRCARKQEMLRNAGYETSTGPSMHEQGQAADLSVRLDLMPTLVEVCKRHFSAYGLAKTFIHVDLRPLKAGKPRSWSYASS